MIFRGSQAHCNPEDASSAPVHNPCDWQQCAILSNGMSCGRSGEQRCHHKGLRLAQPEVISRSCCSRPRTHMNNKLDHRDKTFGKYWSKQRSPNYGLRAASCPLGDFTQSAAQWWGNLDVPAHTTCWHATKPWSLVDEAHLAAKFQQPADTATQEDGDMEQGGKVSQY